MVHRLEEQGSAAYGRLNVVIGTRTPADLLYGTELAHWARPYCGVTVDRAGPGWTGNVGVVTTLLDQAALTAHDTTAFVCGPEAMIRATARELLHRGVRPQHIRVSRERNMHRDEHSRPASRAARGILEVRQPGAPARHRDDLGK